MDEPGTTSRVWIPVLTSLISVIGTIAVAWIGVFPQIRQKDQTQIAKLYDDIAKLDTKLALYAPPESTVSSWVIKGSITRPSGAAPRPVRNAFVALIPIGNANRSQSTDDLGRFVFSDIPSGHYILMIAAQDTGLAERGIIDAVQKMSSQQKSLSTVDVKYDIASEPQ